MSREVRRVPKDWQHPQKAGGYQPMFDQDYASAVAEWKEGYEKWKTDPQMDCEFWEYHGPPPDEEYYRPAWKDEERTHFMMYETTSEGTPISPACETPEALARWLADNEASAFANQTATYEQWLSTIQRGSAVSAVMDQHGLRSGVAALS